MCLVVMLWSIFYWWIIKTMPAESNTKRSDVMHTGSARLQCHDVAGQHTLSRIPVRHVQNSKSTNGISKCQSLTDLRTSSSRDHSDVKFQRGASFIQTPARRSLRDGQKVWKAFIKHTKNKARSLSMENVMTSSAQQRDATNNEARLSDSQTSNVDREWSQLCANASLVCDNKRSIASDNNAHASAANTDKRGIKNTYSGAAPSLITKRGHKLDTAGGSDRRHAERLRGKRALPKLPVTTSSTESNELQQRRKRISEAALKRLQSLRTQVQQHCNDHSDTIIVKQNETCHDPLPASTTRSRMVGEQSSKFSGSHVVNTTAEEPVRSAFTKLKSHKPLSNSVPNNLNLIPNQSMEFEGEAGFLNEIDRIFGLDTTIDSTLDCCEKLPQFSNSPVIQHELKYINTVWDLNTEPLHFIDTVHQQNRHHKLQTRSKVANSNTVTDLSLQLPTLSSLLVTCDVISVTLTLIDSPAKLADVIQLVETAYCEGRDSSGKLYCIRAPVGQRQEIAPSSAFQPVTSGSHLQSDARDSLHYLPSVKIINELLARDSNLNDGDFLIELNGAFVMDQSIGAVAGMLSRLAFNCCTLVVARPNVYPSNFVQNKSTNGFTDADLSGKIVINNGLHTDTNESFNACDVTDNTNHRLNELEKTLERYQRRVYTIEKELDEREDKVMEWKREANRKDTELARMRLTVQHNQAKISQLEKRISKQNEMLFASRNAVNTHSNISGEYGNDIGRQVSAV